MFYKSYVVDHSNSAVVARLIICESLKFRSQCRQLLSSSNKIAEYTCFRCKSFKLCNFVIVMFFFIPDVDEVKGYSVLDNMKCICSWFPFIKLKLNDER